jgi:putative heme-binding domain-containing protein
MYGVLVVVEDAKTYLAENDPLPSADQLLGIVTCTHDYDALVADMSQLQSGRSFENGQRQFTRASCLSCHSMQGKGASIGPELTEISKKYKPHEILRHMMYPSEAIDPKFAKVEIIDDDGKQHLGVIVKETETEIHLMIDPLADCEPEVIAKTEDIERFPSKVSPMPEGLLDRVCGEALWDLLAYVIAGGDPANPAFAEK